MKSLLECLADRNFDILLHPETVIDSPNRVITFPLYNLSGQMVGFQEYRPDQADKGQNSYLQRHLHRYYAHNRRCNTVCWGLQSLHWDVPYVFVQEGVFDTAPFHSLGVPAVAMLGFDNQEAYKALRTSGKKLYTLADADRSGRIMFNTVGAGRWLGYSAWHDVGQIPLDALQQIVDHTLRG